MDERQLLGLALGIVYFGPLAYWLWTTIFPNGGKIVWKRRNG